MPGIIWEYEYNMQLDGDLMPQQNGVARVDDYVEPQKLIAE